MYLYSIVLFDWGVLSGWEKGSDSRAGTGKKTLQLD